MRLQVVQGAHISVQWFVSTTPHFSPFSCDLIWVLHRLQFLWGVPAPVWSHLQATVPTGKYLLQHGFFTGHSPFRDIVHLLILYLAISSFPYQSLCSLLHSRCLFLNMIFEGATSITEGLSCVLWVCCRAGWNQLCGQSLTSSHKGHPCSLPAAKTLTGTFNIFPLWEAPPELYISHPS